MKLKQRIFYSISQKKNQFTIKFRVNEKNIEISNEVKLLGTVITDNLKWDRNTEKLVKKGYIKKCKYCIQQQKLHPKKMI